MIFRATNESVYMYLCILERKNINVCEKKIEEEALLKECECPICSTEFNEEDEYPMKSKICGHVICQNCSTKMECQRKEVLSYNVVWKNSDLKFGLKYKIFSLGPPVYNGLTPTPIN